MPRGSVLLVEDEAMIAMMLEEQLQFLDFAVFASVSDVGAALAALSGDDLPDVGLLDCRLGEDRSWSVARRLDELGIPFIFMTGAPDDHFPDDLAGAQRLGKPFTINAIEQVLDEALAKR